MKQNRLTVVLVGTALLWLAPFVTAGTVSVSNLMVAQRPGTKLVDITYDVAVTVWTNANISLAVSNSGVQVVATNLTGDVGSVAPGTAKSIVWDMGADWNGNQAELSFVLLATSTMPIGGDPSATNWTAVNERWVRNYYTNGAITMRDRTSNTMWVYHASANGKHQWSDAISHCTSLVYAGYSDWDLPGLSALRDIYSQKEFFTGFTYEKFLPKL